MRMRPRHDRTEVSRLEQHRASEGDPGWAGPASANQGSRDPDDHQGRREQQHQAHAVMQSQKHSCQQGQKRRCGRYRSHRSTLLAEHRAARHTASTLILLSGRSTPNWPFDQSALAVAGPRLLATYRCQRGRFCVPEALARTAALSQIIQHRRGFAAATREWPICLSRKSCEFIRSELVPNSPEIAFSSATRASEVPLADLKIRADRQ